MTREIWPCEPARATEKELQIKSHALREADRELADKEAELTKLLGERSLVAS